MSPADRDTLIQLLSALLSLRGAIIELLRGTQDIDVKTNVLKELDGTLEPIKKLITSLDEEKK